MSARTDWFWANANRLFARTKRMVGISSTAGIVAFFAVPGPHTMVVLGGLAVGATAAMFTGKGREYIKFAK